MESVKRKKRCRHPPIQVTWTLTIPDEAFPDDWYQVCRDCGATKHYKNGVAGFWKALPR